MTKAELEDKQKMLVFAKARMIDQGVDTDAIDHEITEVSEALQALVDASSSAQDKTTEESTKQSHQEDPKDPSKEIVVTDATEDNAPKIADQWFSIFIPKKFVKKKKAKNNYMWIISLGKYKVWMPLSFLREDSGGKGYNGRLSTKANFYATEEIPVKDKISATELIRVFPFEKVAARDK